MMIPRGVRKEIKIRKRRKIRRVEVASSDFLALSPMSVLEMRARRTISKNPRRRKSPKETLWLIHPSTAMRVLSPLETFPVRCQMEMATGMVPTIVRMKRMTITAPRRVKQDLDPKVQLRRRILF